MERRTPCASATGKGMSRRVVTVVLLLNWAFFVPIPGQAIPGFFTSERGAGPGHALARLTSRVLFNNNRSQEGAPILAYGYLSHVDGLPVASKKAEDESSAALTIVVEGRVADLEQSDSAFMVESEGTLRVFFAPQAKRSFAHPDSFRSGEEVAAYNLRRYVIFNSTSDWLRDRSFASLVSSKPFTFRGATIDLRSLWGTQLIIEAQARGREAQPSPLPEYSAAIPYSGALFIGGERTEHTSPWPFLTRKGDSSLSQREGERVRVLPYTLDTTLPCSDSSARAKNSD